MDQMWTFLGQEYPFDISDAECLDKMGKVFSVADELDSDDEGLSPSEKAEKLCKTVRSFFAVLFGEEGSQNICGLNQSAARCTEAYLDFIAFLNRQVDEFSRIRELIEQKYSMRASSLASSEQESA